MNDAISIRRYNDHTKVHVTRHVGVHKVHWMVRVLNTPPTSYAAAITECKQRVATLAALLPE